MLIDKFLPQDHKIFETELFNKIKLSKGDSLVSITNIFVNSFVKLHVFYEQSRSILFQQFG